MFSFIRLILITFCCTLLLACGPKSPMAMSELAEGKRQFETGYYKRAFHLLLPLASDGNAEAQYAVGYMYYYGYGVAQDTETGFFWIKKSASQGYAPAERALRLMANKQHARSNKMIINQKN